jgi:hypothetical protein
MIFLFIFHSIHIALAQGESVLEESARLGHSFRQRGGKFL